MLVPRSRYDEAIGLLETAFRNAKYGDPTQPGALQGPPVVQRVQHEVGFLKVVDAVVGAQLPVGASGPTG